jgi:hypothetical protein
VQQVTKQEVALRTQIQQVAAKVAEKKWTASYAADVRKTHMAARQLDRLADRLAVEGEPAGVDLRARAVYLDRLVSQVADDCRKIPGVASEMSKDKSVAHEKAANMAKRLTGITLLTKRGNWEEAYLSLYALRDEVSAMALWYFQADQAGMLNHFEETRRAIEAEVTKRRVEAAQAAMKEEIERQLPDFNGLVARVRTAAESVRSTGMADFGGEMFSGPQLLQRFGEEWKNQLVLAMQCGALNAARRGATQGSDLEAAVALEKQQPEFAKQVVSALVELIRADVEQAPEEQVRERYLAYLPVVATFNALSPEDALAQAAAPALDELAARSQTLAAEVKAYRTVTDDLLRWRRRIAAAYAQRALENFPPITDTFKEAGAGQEVLRDVVPATARSPQRVGLRTPVWQVLEAVVPQLLEKPVSVDHLTGLPVSTRMTVSGYNDRTLVQVTVGDHLEAELQLLKAELLLGGSSKPLSLAAASAVVTAERGDLVSLGGTIRQVAVDAVVTRFGSLKPSLWPLALCDFDADSATHDRPLAQILFRYTVEPAWLHHEYLFARLAPVETPAE